ncbi:aquaporin-1 [Podospora aff. communis PSN243]|uniref:Aquaporin-1 n=1 Tax=Podospora aff. communis PSN243 TaxID=3040156 RepID=A0AAV9FZV6_9PEZI|nr:aquaporin-1 [Podospora aff. communis PSN243]
MESKTPPKYDPDRLHRRRITLSPMESNLVATVGEFAGTFLFLYFAYAGNLMAASRAPTLSPSDPDGTMRSDTIVFISLAYSFSLLVNVWAFYRISGGLFNPAVTLGLCLSSKLPWTRGIMFIPAQLLASLCAGGLVSAMFPVPIAEANSLLGGGTSIPQGLFMEMFFTALLVFVVLMLAIEKSKDTFLAPIGIGLALFVAMLAGTGYTGGSLNPARSLGCAVAARQFPGYHWIYWLGPLLGSLLATGFYALVKYFHYEEANPGQDAAHPGEVPRSPV